MSILLGTALLTLEGPDSAIVFAAFSPDGKRVATAGSDGIAKNWDIATGNILLSLPIEGGRAMAVAFSPDGKLLAVGAGTGIQIFILPGEDLVALAKSRVTRTLTTEECLKYLHLNACPASP